MTDKITNKEIDEEISKVKTLNNLKTNDINIKGKIIPSRKVIEKVRKEKELKEINDLIVVEEKKEIKEKVRKEKLDKPKKEKEAKIKGVLKTIFILSAITIIFVTVYNIIKHDSSSNKYKNTFFSKIRK